VKACWEGRGTLLERGGLGAVSLFYRAGLEIHRGLYRWGVREALRLPVPVISVGNITVGGAGKTPMVAWLARGLRDRGFKVAIVSRGYGRKASRGALLVSRGEGPLVSPIEGGDEPVMLAKKLPGVAVVVAHRKAHGARWAVDELGAQLILVDDGFQHWSLARDLDLVLVDGGMGFGNGRLFPAGPLREPLGALKRAHILVLTKESNPALSRFLSREAPQADLFEAPLEAVDLWSPQRGEVRALEPLHGLTLGAFAGIAQPSSFFALLERGGGRLVERVVFPDHLFYGDREVERLSAVAERVDMMITTEKDWVKLEGMDLPFSLWVLRVALSPPGELLDRVLERLGLEA